ncbi:hypothetical protein VE03_09499 [Pseudogymnoascus sp. 23342-1-I1]|nr:hypothetical protein VE03_09499 [Pseudogymnoascus sp. 23342-1-I1]
MLTQVSPTAPLTITVQTRTETDALDSIQAPANKYWDAQTQRFLSIFQINQPAFGIMKGAAATVNMTFGVEALVTIA